jgi:hypothetical protein
MIELQPSLSYSWTRLTRICAVAAACIGCFLIVHQIWNTSGTGIYDRSGAVLGQDFLAFYTGWRLVLTEPTALYDLSRQHELQQVLRGAHDTSGIYAFINPPAFAACFALLGLLPYRWAYIVWELIGAIALTAALLYLRPLLPALRGWRWWAAIGFMLGFAPFFDVISDGQNTFLSLLLHVLILRALLADRPLLAGALIGLGLLKPQLFIPILPLALLVRGWRVLPGFAVSAGIQVALATVLVGSSWFGQLLWLLQEGFADQFAAHAWKKYSWEAFFMLLLGVEHPLTRPLTLIACGVTFCWLAWVWHRGELRLAYAATLFAALLVIPTGSAYAYDLFLLAGGALLAAGVLLEQPAGSSSELLARRLLIGSLAMIYALAIFDRGTPFMGWQPVVPLMLVATLVAGWLALAPNPARAW